MTFFEFQKRFPNEGAALNFIVATKYANGYYCPKCGCFHKGIYRSNKRTKVLHCNNCKSEFSVLAGTIFEGTHLDLRMWLYAINLVIVAKKGISACQLQRELGMKSYKGAWRMLQLIRQAMAKEEYNEVFEAVVEIDETYVGGKPRKSNVHTERETNEKFNKRGRGTSKTPVIGVKVDHSVTYSLGDGKHTNGIESFWAIVKRGVYGVYHHISVDYMQRYMDEFCFRLNHRECDDAFESLVNLAIAA